jgi:prepilin-type N-terminal cleavage/methylation domain-containing protein
MMAWTQNRPGVTFIEVMIVLIILGILALSFYPAIVNVTQVRSLEAQARELMMDLNKAKLMAVKDRAEVRLVFSQDTNSVWGYIVQEDTGSGWAVPGGFIRKSISKDYQVTINLPDYSVEYSPLGMVDNYAAGLNTISLSSPKLKELKQPNVRSLLVFAGGSIQYSKSSS